MTLSMSFIFDQRLFPSNIIPMLQLTSLITERGNPFNLISSLLIGLAITLIAATFLFQYFRNRKGGEELKHDDQ